MELFILLSRDTFKSDVLLSLERRFQLCSDITLPDEFNKFTEEEKIDWNKYLQEGSEKFRLLLNGSEVSIIERLLCDSLRFRILMYFAVLLFSVLL